VTDETVMRVPTTWKRISAQMWPRSVVTLTSAYAPDACEAELLAALLRRDLPPDQALRGRVKDRSFELQLVRDWDEYRNTVPSAFGTILPGKAGSVVRIEVRGGKLGVLTERAVVGAMAIAGVMMLLILVGQLLTRPVGTVPPEVWVIGLGLLPFVLVYIRVLSATRHGARPDALIRRLANIVEAEQVTVEGAIHRS
jgi:hypothetical protein